MVLHGETVYGSGQNCATLDPTVASGVVGRSTVDWIASLGVPFTEIDGRTNFQVFQRIYLDGGDDAVALKSGNIRISAYVSAKLGGVWEPQLLWIQTFGGGGSLVRPRLNWTGIKNATPSLGVDIFAGANDGYFGRYNDRDRVYGEVRVAFRAARARANVGPSKRGVVKGNISSGASGASSPNAACEDLTRGCD